MTAGCFASTSAKRSRILRRTSSPRAKAAIHPPGQPSTPAINSAVPSANLPVLPLRLTLFDERLHAFLLIVGCEQGMENAPLEAHALGERRLERDVDRLLARHHRRQRH